MNIYKRSFDDQTQIRIKLEKMAINSIFQLVEQNQYDIYWSFILDYENSLNPSIERQQAAIPLSTLCVETILPDETIQLLANKIELHSSIPPRDALHLSCAEFANCQYFITCDDKLIRRFNTLKSMRALELKIEPINPIDFILEVINGEVSL
jgi:predicted nucleic acid-binding protein